MRSESHFSRNGGYADPCIRERIYAEGGILSVTSRILVVDLLSSKLRAFWPLSGAMLSSPELLDPEKVTGMIILHADKYGRPAYALIYVFR